MKRIYQTKYARHGTNGDCFAACVASILERPLSRVQDFYADVPIDQPVPAEVAAEMDEWFKENGLIYVEIAIQDQVGDLTTLLRSLSQRIYQMHYILIGVGRANETHAVVCFEDQVVHNPASVSPHEPLQGPCHDGYYRVGVVSKRVP
jgi:hypothetical protein